MSENKNALKALASLPRPAEDSTIFYRKWFDCFMAQGEKNCAKLFMAFFSLVFYGTDIESFHLPRRLESIIEAFLPIVETNARKRNGGKKGGQFGIYGGRPLQNGDSKTPMGLNGKTPMGIDPSHNNDNGSENGKNTNNNVSVNLAHTTHTDYSRYVPVFFFRNLRHPVKQAQKFATHYEATGWRLGGGEYMVTQEQRIAAAKIWEVRDDSGERFKKEDLEMWQQLYDIAPPEIQVQMIQDMIEIRRTADAAYIKGPLSISNWIEGNLNETKPIVTKWMNGRRYSFVPSD